MKYAWIENNKIRDIAHDEPTAIYHPDIAKFYDTLVDDDIQNGWERNEHGQWVEPEKPIIEIPPPPRIITPFDVRTCLTFGEKVAWDNDLDPAIKTAKTELQKVNMTRSEAQEIIDWLVNKGILSQDSGVKVLELY
jgi:hypothetical protein